MSDTRVQSLTKFVIFLDSLLIRSSSPTNFFVPPRPKILERNFGENSVYGTVSVAQSCVVETLILHGGRSVSVNYITRSEL